MMITNLSRLYFEPVNAHRFDLAVDHAARGARPQALDGY